MLKRSLLCAALMGVGFTVPAEAQEAPAPFRRLPMQEEAYPPPQHKTHMFTLEMRPGGVVPRHTHPGTEMAYVIEGEGDLEVQGQPERRVKAGESYHVPGGVPHALRNGNAPLRAIVFYVVDKDKPLASPAP